MALDALSYGDANKRVGQVSVAVDLQVNPLLPAKINIDGTLYTAPTKITLPIGTHQFSAISNIADQFVTYTFKEWRLNGRIISSNATTIINVTGDCIITADYMLGESNWGAPARPDSLPNPNGPMTPNLVLKNPTSLDAYKEV